MKFLMIFFMFILLIGSSPLESRENFKGIRYDYLLHYQTGVITATTIDQWNRGFWNIGEDYGILSIGIPMLLGAAKEYHDFRSNNKKFVEDAYKDFGFTILGAISGKFLSMSF